MKRYLYVILVLVLSACELIPESEQLIELTEQESEATVLLTEFTGVGCVNCPLAAAEARELKRHYGERLVVVEMHPKSNPFTAASAEYDYTSAAADEYYKQLGGVSSTPLPTGVINMQRVGTEYFVDYTSWGKEIEKAMHREVQTRVELRTKYEGRKLDVEVELSQEVAGGKLLIWLTEDSIVGAQLMPDGTTNLQYVHNHILREEIYKADAENANTKVDIKDKYRIEQLNVVAVVLSSEGEVLATAEKALIEKADESEAADEDKKEEGGQTDEEDKEQGGEGDKDKQKEDVPFLFSIDEVGDIKRDTTICITNYSINVLTGKPEMEMHGLLAYDGKLEVDIVRQDADIDDQFCCGQKCVNTNYELTQHIEFAIDKTSSWFAHFTPEEEGDYKIEYTFNNQDLYPRKLMVIYQYKK